MRPSKAINTLLATKTTPHDAAILIFESHLSAHSRRRFAERQGQSRRKKKPAEAGLVHPQKYLSLAGRQIAKRLHLAAPKRGRSSSELWRTRRELTN